MKIAVINNKKLIKRIKQTDLGKKEEVITAGLNDIKNMNHLIIIDYNTFLNNLKTFSEIPVVLYVNNRELREAIKFLRKGVIDIIPEDAKQGELNSILSNSMEAFKLFKRKENYSEINELKQLISNFVFTYSLKESIEKASKYIKEKTGLSRVFISIVKRGKEKIISGIGEDFNNITEKYKNLKNFPWIEILKVKKDILIFKKTTDDINLVHPNGFIKIPLFIKDDLIGTITLDNYKKELVLDFDKELILSAAMLISMHIENHRVYVEAIKTKELLKEKEQKEILNKLVNTLNHEINNPLTIAYLNLESLRRKMENPNGTLKNLEGIEVSLERIKDIMDNVNKINSGKFLMMMRNRDLFNLRYEV